MELLRRTHPRRHADTHLDYFFASPKFALGEVDLERIVPYGFGGWFGEEPLDVQ